MEAPASGAIGWFHASLGVVLLLVGALTITARKRPRSRHTLVGEWYFSLLVITLVSGFTIGVIEHPGRYTLFQIVTPPTLAAGVFGYWMAKRRGSFLGQPWLRLHIIGQASSYIGVCTATAFQVFPRFLPDNITLSMLYWSVPTIIGSWLIARTVRRWAPHPLMRGPRPDGVAPR